MACGVVVGEAGPPPGRSMTVDKTIDLRGKVGDWGRSADLLVRDRWAGRRGDSGVQSAETRDETLSRSLQAARPAGIRRTRGWRAGGWPVRIGRWASATDRVPLLKTNFRKGNRPND
jgi:hypothetical protein